MLKIKLNEILIPGLCGLLAVVISVSLYADLTGRSGSSTEEAVGFITYRYRVAQRRYASRVIWEDVEQKDRVFNQDSIRTDDRSEAIITLSDGAKIEMDPQSMIVLIVRDKETVIETKQGSVLVRDAAGVLLKADINGKSTIVRPEGDVRFTLQDPVIEVQGTAIREDGKRMSGRTQIRDQLLTEIKNPFRMDAPVDNFRVFVADSAEIGFSWDGPQGQHTLEISNDRDVNDVIRTEHTRGNTTVKLPEGIYYWRLKAQDQVSPVHKFRIIRKIGIECMTPFPGANIKLSDSAPYVPLRWTESRLAVRYRVRVSHKADLSEPLIEKDLLRTGFSAPLVAGKYFWKVEAVGALMGSNTETVLQEFTVEDARKPDREAKVEEKAAQEVKTETTRSDKPVVVPPVLIFPGSGQQLDMAALDAIPFQWRAVPDAERYVIVLYNGTAGRTEVFRTETTQPGFMLRDLSVLDTGTFYWEVEVRSKGQSAKSQSAFTIVLSAQPDKPTLRQQ
ncbi:MAG: hypothetical protein K8S54_13390 [Spirochaetia bacterium]|nr:hypothetical protein [Spirochaetia bacterium]